MKKTLMILALSLISAHAFATTETHLTCKSYFVNSDNEHIIVKISLKGDTSASLEVVSSPTNIYGTSSNPKLGEKANLKKDGNLPGRIYMIGQSRYVLTRKLENVQASDSRYTDRTRGYELNIAKSELNKSDGIAINLFTSFENSSSVYSDMSFTCSKVQ